MLGSHGFRCAFFGEASSRLEGKHKETNQLFGEGISPLLGPKGMNLIWRKMLEGSVKQVLCVCVT